MRYVPMMATLLAIRTSWVGILFVLAIVAGLWLVVRAAIDFAVWFNEEILEDFRQRRRKRKESQDSKQ